jgi:hypothetical protein
MAHIGADEDAQDYLANLRRRVGELEAEQRAVVSAAAARQRQLARDLWRRTP